MFGSFRIAKATAAARLPPALPPIPSNSELAHNLMISVQQEIHNLINHDYIHVHYIFKQARMIPGNYYIIFNLSRFKQIYNINKQE